MKKKIAIFMSLLTIFACSMVTGAMYDGTADSIYMGRFSIDGTQVQDLPLYYTNSAIMLSEVVQQIVDWENAGVYQDDSVKANRTVSPLIADHKHQGFDCLWETEIGDTCVLEYANGEVQRFVCRDIDPFGVNDEQNILTSEGTMAAMKYPASWICTYTCNPEGWWTVTIVWWEPVVFEPELESEVNIEN